MATAITLGADMLEFHMTLDRSWYGSDHASSIQSEGVMKIAKYAREIPLSLGTGNKVISEEEHASKLRQR